MPAQLKYNAKIHKAIIDRLRRGAYTQTAARELGLTYETVRRWIHYGDGDEHAPGYSQENQERFAKFARDVRMAKAEAEMNMLATWQDVAVNGAEEEVVEERYERVDGASELQLTGKLIRKTSKKDWRAAQALLASRNAALWNPKSQVEHTHEVKQEITVHDGPAPHAEGDEGDE